MNHVEDQTQGNPSFDASGQRIIPEGRSSSIACIFPNKPLGPNDEIQRCIRSSPDSSHVGCNFEIPGIPQSTDPPAGGSDSENFNQR